MIGVVQHAGHGDAPDGEMAHVEVAYVAAPVSFTAELRALTEPVDAAEVLRLAGPCVEERCAHHIDNRCTLGDRVVAELPPVVQRVPRCSIRRRCRWYAEQGVAACLRCPGIVTSTRSDDDRLRVTAAPPATLS